MLNEFITQRLKRGLTRRLNNLKIMQVAKLVTRNSPPASGAPVVFFKASTGIDDLSWNSGFHLLASWALRLKGIPVAYFACNAGMSKCVLGVNRDHPHQAMPCKACVSQSKALYTGIQVDRETGTHVNWFGFERNAQLAARIENLSVPELSTFHFQDLPLGSLPPRSALDFTDSSFER
jgi:hypothetical protein